MRIRTSACLAAAGILIAGGAEMAPSFELSSQHTVDVAAGRMALGSELPAAIDEQMMGVVALKTEVPTYSDIDPAQKMPGDPVTNYGSAVVLPIRAGNNWLAVSAGHNGINQKVAAKYNCSQQQMSAFVGRTSFAQANVKAAAGVLTNDRDISLLEVPVEPGIHPITNYHSTGVNGLHTGSPIYIAGYAASEKGEIRTPANVSTLASDQIGTKQDISQPVIFGGLVLSADPTHERLNILTGLNESYGAQYSDSTYYGDSGGAAFVPGEGLVGVTTNSIDGETPADIQRDFGVTLRHATNKKYQVTVVNIIQDKDIKDLQAKFQDCAPTRQPIPAEDADVTP